MRRPEADGARRMLRDEAALRLTQGAWPWSRQGAGRRHHQGGGADRVRRNAAGHLADHGRGNLPLRESGVHADRTVLRHTDCGHGFPGETAHSLIWRSRIFIIWRPALLAKSSERMLPTKKPAVSVMPGHLI